ncbi:MAG TPA: universal stress protein [Rhizobacter sp.]|nr:universal stress protein [Rhizobacter sp.]
MPNQAMYQHLLIPIDDSEPATALVGQAADLARRLGARLTFLQVLPAQGAAAARELCAKAEAAARALGVPCSSLALAADDPGAAIAETASAQGCDLIMLATHAEAQAVLRHGEHPLLVAALSELPPPVRAIAVIRAEHRALAAVLHAWSDLLASAVACQRAPDAAAMRMALQYLRGFSRVQHHPKETDLLFKLLSLRTTRLDAELCELERQGERDAELLAELHEAVERAATSAEGVQPLQRLLSHYCDFMWDHLGREEGVVLPAAQRWLQAEDWAFLDMVYQGAQTMPFAHPSADAVLSVLQGAR